MSDYRRYLQSGLISIGVFSVLAAGIVAFTNYKNGLWEKDVRNTLLDVLTGKKSALEKALYSRIFYTRGVAAYVSMHPDISNQEYAVLAKEYIHGDSVINSMALSKNGVISDIYPLEGHEEALGLNLLEHPERRKIVEKTIETRLTFIAGPVELVEGGTAFISYTPVFDKTIAGSERFWGVTDIVIKYDQLLAEAGLNEVENHYKFALRGSNGDGDAGDVFWGDADIFNDNPVRVEVELPIGSWVLAVEPEKGWKHLVDQDQTLFLSLLFSALIISLLLGIVVNAFAKINRNEKELKAIFGALDSLVIELSPEGKYLKIAAINEEMLVQPKEKLLGKSVYDFFDRDVADYFVASIQKCLTSKKLVVIEYKLLINGKETWFTARISYKNRGSAIFNAYDITEEKKQERLLKESEQQLKKLNASKDKFFSIIAHDLRSPLAGQQGVIDILVDEHDALDRASRKELLQVLQQSSVELNNLLENLLRWALSQSGSLKGSPKEQELRSMFDSVMTQFASRARLKKIQLENHLQEQVFVYADTQLANTVLRNLVSNAIKFTHKEGIVRVQSEIISDASGSFCKISVEDSGVGIAPEVLETLFTAGENRATDGTDNEKGSGLGLLLCKEFVDIQGGKIWAESTPGDGAVFAFTLPLYA